MKMIELYLISGFLGSGKTTFLKQLLEQSHKKVGVIVNEFGSVGIDGKILEKEDLKMVEINNGSIFCACLKGDFVKTLVAFLEQSIEVLFVEASGMADPSSMKNLLAQLTLILEKKPQINSQYKYKGSICLIDASHFLEFSEMFIPTKNQVKKSSLLVLNKIDQVLQEDVDKLHIVLTQINNKAYIYDTMYGKVPLELIKTMVRPDGVIEEETTNTIWNRPDTYIIEMNDTYDINKMRDFALALSEKVLRLKGLFLTLENQIAHADCVADYIKIELASNQEIKFKDSLKIVLIVKHTEDYEELIGTTWHHYFPEKVLRLEKDKAIVKQNNYHKRPFTYKL